MNEIQRLIHEMCPDGVPMVALNSLCNVLRGKRLTKDKLSPNGKYPVFHGGLEPLGYYDSSNRPANSVMVINVGASAGTVGFCNHEFWSSDGCFSISHNPLLHSKFLYYYLFGQTKNIQRKVRVAGIPTLDNAVVEKIQIPLPPLPIQQRIVEILDKFTSLVSSLDSEIALRQKQYEYYRNKLLSFEEGVNKVKLESVISNLRTGLNPRIHFTLNTPDAQGYYITVRELKGFTIEPDEKTDRINEEARIRINERSKLQIDDILFSGTGTIGRTALLTEEPSNWNIKEGVYAITPQKNKILPRFLLHVLHTSSIKEQIDGKAAGAAVKSIPMSEFKLFQIPLPSLDKQQRIVRTLDTFESLLTNLKKERELRQKQYEYYREKLLTFA